MNPLSTLSAAALNQSVILAITPTMIRQVSNLQNSDSRVNLEIDYLEERMELVLQNFCHYQENFQDRLNQTTHTPLSTMHKFRNWLDLSYVEMPQQRFNVEERLVKQRIKFYNYHLNILYIEQADIETSLEAIYKVADASLLRLNIPTRSDNVFAILQLF